MTALEFTLLVSLAVVLTIAWSLRLRLRAANTRAGHEIATAQTRHAELLEAQTKRVLGVFDRMIDGVLIVGLDGRIRLANRAAEEFFGATRPMVGQTILEATRRHEVAAILLRTEQEPEVLDRELRLEHAGKVRTLQINALALTAVDGTREGALMIFHDVSRLRELESVRQDFVANVSHELRTPLSLIKSAAETLIDGGKADPVITDRFLEIIDKNASRLTLLIDDLLLLARLDSGRLELQLHPVVLQRAVQEAIEDAAPSARARSATLRNDVPVDVMALADPDRLRQVLANLIDNAIKYGRPSGVVVLAGRVVDSRYVEISVHDDGPGIPPEAKARVFERFYRIDRARSREQGGTGLGLAIVKNVVEAHGGDIRVETGNGIGTTFSFTLRNGADPQT
jgi:two-component system phosphate regulon sensor histidine kinase PhoR